MFALIETWEQSELTQHVFCDEQDIRFSCFQYWRTRYKQYREGNDDFICVLTKTSWAEGVEISYPNGISLRLPSQIGVWTCYI